ncbi:hypothetical protein, partial [Bacteroides salyersiae]|uniref:hypothetical protein n=1 Tax=Bacteroides salyersiae TaxID=291644 RepID=UPI0032C09371
TTTTITTALKNTFVFIIVIFLLLLFSLTIGRGFYQPPSLLYSQELCQNHKTLIIRKYSF